MVCAVTKYLIIFPGLGPDLTSSLSWNHLVAIYLLTYYIWLQYLIILPTLRQLVLTNRAPGGRFGWVLNEVLGIWQVACHLAGETRKDLAGSKAQRKLLRSYIWWTCNYEATICQSTCSNLNWKAATMLQPCACLTKGGSDQSIRKICLPHSLHPDRINACLLPEVLLRPVVGKFWCVWWLAGHPFVTC